MRIKTALASGEYASLERPLAIAAYAAAALAVNVGESFLVLPVPVLRVGLANAFVILALWRWGPAAALGVTVTKVCGAALVLGTLASPVFGLNAGGALASWAVLTAAYFLSRRDYRVVVVASAAAGCAHAAWQLCFIRWLTGTPWAFTLGGPLLVWGLATGIVVGVVARNLQHIESGGGYAVCGG